MKIISILATILIAFVQLPLFGQARIQWDTAKGTYRTSMLAFVQSQKTGSIIASGGGSALFRSSDNGRSWAQVNIFITYKDMATVACNDSGVFVVGTQGDGILRSSDDGLTFVKYLSTLVNGELFTGIVHVPTDQGHFVGVTNGDGCFVSRDSGSTWTASNDGLSTVFLTSLKRRFNGELWIGTYGEDGLFKSTDEGATWTSIVTGWEFGTITNIVFRGEDYVYVTTKMGGIIRSNDGGMTWRAINEGLSSTEVTTLILDQNGTLHAGTKTSGIYSAPFSDSLWIQNSDGLRTGSVTALFVNKWGTAFAGLAHDGIYFSRDPIASVWQTLTEELKAAPNPANSFVRLSNIKTTQSSAFVDVYSTSGNRVLAFSNTPLESGELLIDCSPLSAGSYTARVHLENRVSVSHFIVVR